MHTFHKIDIFPQLCFLLFEGENPPRLFFFSCTQSVYLKPKVGNSLFITVPDNSRLLSFPRISKIILKCMILNYIHTERKKNKNTLNIYLFYFFLFYIPTPVTPAPTFPTLTPLPYHPRLLLRKGKVSLGELRKSGILS